MMCFSTTGINFRKNLAKKDYQKKLEEVLKKKKEL